ncbi:hypothetical protein [Streptacidiphilus rugosus]|uniref:hypothetical protein n=1 Tax=Streptacidiphilus rugosus TaxID=405783 RepID=UPI00055E4FFA|nr:hypothetical protein [Streptacidiphilus rugosus]
MSHAQLQQLVDQLGIQLAQQEGSGAGDLRLAVAEATARVSEYLELAEEIPGSDRLAAARVVAEIWWEVLQTADRWSHTARPGCVLVA